MSEHPRYRVESLKDFDTIPTDKLDACLSDFREWLDMRRLVAAVFDPEALTVLDVFEWVDDGVQGVSDLRFVDSETGEEIDLFDREEAP